MRINLIIKRQWFDEIRSGKKTKEYRETTERMINQICETGERDGEFLQIISFKPVTEILLLNGYHKNRPTMLVECTGIEITTETDECGEYDMFVFSLGKILKTENC